MAVGLPLRQVFRGWSVQVAAGRKWQSLVFWSPVAAVLALLGLGSKISVVKTETVSRRSVVAEQSFLSGPTTVFGSLSLVAPTLTCTGVGKWQAGTARSDCCHCLGCCTNLTIGLGPDGSGSKLGRGVGRVVHEDQQLLRSEVGNVEKVVDLLHIGPAICP